MKFRTASVALALVACSAPALPSAASAQTDNSNRIRIFSVTAEGSGSYAYSDVWESLPGHFSEIRDKIDFKWNAKLPAVAFYSNGEAIVTGTAAVAEGKLTAAATAETNIRGFDGKGNVVTTHGYCENKDASRDITTAVVIPDPITGEKDAGADFVIKPFPGLTFRANCTAAIYNGATDISLNAAEGALDQRFHLPREATRQGKIIQLVQAEPDQRNRCNTGGSWGVSTCSLDWHGTLTFEFTGYLGEGEITPDDIPLPPPGGAQPPAPVDDEDLIPLPPGPPVTPPEEDEDLLLVPLPSNAKASAKSGTASVNVKCASACSGTVSAFAAGKVRGAAAKPLARAKFKTAAGKAKTVKLRFRGAALRKVRKAKSVRLVIDTGAAKKTVVVKPR